MGRTVRTCPTCAKSFDSKHFNRHVTRHQKDLLRCQECLLFVAKTQADLDYHTAKKHSTVTTDDVFTCALCSTQFPDYYVLREHKGSVHGVSIYPTITSDPDLSIYSDNTEFQNELGRIKHLLGYYFKEEKHQFIFNFPLNEPSHSKLEDYLDYVFERLPCAAKINILFGFMLRHQETGKFRYFYADKNNPLFTAPVFVRDPVNLAFLKDRLKGEDYFEHVTSQRQSTKWRFFQMTNVSIRATLVRDIPLGCYSLSLPLWIRQHRFIHSHVFNSSNDRANNDNLCLFRGMARHYEAANLEAKTSEIFSQYLTARSLDARNFRGVRLSDIHMVEDIFTLNIVVYGADYVQNRVRGELIHRSRGIYESTVSFIRYDRHMCYVRDIAKVFHSHICPHCTDLFRTTQHLNRHVLVCGKRDKDLYPGGPYVLSRTIFEKLEEEGIIVPADLRLYPYMAVFDFESICRPSYDINDTECISFLGKHVPISVSIASNLESEPRFIVNKDPAALVREFVLVLETLAAKSKVHMMERLGCFLETLEGKILGVEREWHKAMSL